MFKSQSIVGGIATAMLIATAPCRAQPNPQYAPQERAALAAVDAYVKAFNARDPEAFARTLHYPHMRVDGLGRPTVWNTWQEYAREIDFKAIVARANWHHTEYGKKGVIHSGKDKVHVAVQFTRYNAANEPILTSDSFYVVTLRDGRWAIQVRSSFLESGSGTLSVTAADD